MNPYDVRELRPGDEQILEALALETDDFDNEGPQRPARPLAADRASAFLWDRAVHLWVALADALPVGFLLAYTLRRRHGDAVQLFLYELGVRRAWRRQGVGTALVTHMLEGSRRAGIERGFLLTGERNAGAIAFYDSLGWRADDQRDLVYSFRIPDRSEPTGRG